MANIVDRMIRASRLEASLYEEVEADTTATNQALTVVVISSAAAGIGNVAHGGAMGAILGVVGALIGWAVFAGLTYLIGTKVFPEAQTKADWGELLRTLGFASAPGVLRIFLFIPIAGPLIGLVAGIWMLVTGVIAVRQALDYTSTWRAIGVCVAGWFVMVFIGMVVGLFAAGVGVATGSLEAQ